MLTKAIILGKEPNTNKYTIRLPLLETAASPDNYITKATLCSDDGVINPFNVGDVVYVGFENNMADQPVILGKLSKDGLLGAEDTLANASYDMNSLTVRHSAVLPKDIKIGDIEYNVLEELLNKQSAAVDLDVTLGSESITVGSKTLNVVTRDTDQEVSGAKNFTADVTTVKKLVVNDEGIEIYDNTTPYIDFHYQNGTVDYTLRLIETPQGTLNVSNSSNNAKITIEGVEVTTTANTVRNLGEITESTLTDLAALAGNQKPVALIYHGIPYIGSIHQDSGTTYAFELESLDSSGRYIGFMVSGTTPVSDLFSSTYSNPYIDTTSTQTISGAKTFSEVVQGSSGFTGDGTAALTAKSTNEVYFLTSSGDSIYLNYGNNVISGKTTPSKYLFGNGTGSAGQTSGIIYAGTIYQNGGQVANKEDLGTQVTYSVSGSTLTITSK